MLPPEMNPPHDKPRAGTQRAAALIIVLAFVVLLTGLVLAFFSNSLLYRQISNSSASEAKVDLYAQGAVDAIVGDLKQEIAAGSTAYVYEDRNSVPVRGAIVGQDYQPLNAAAAVPALALAGKYYPAVTSASFAPNLVKRSAYHQNFYPAQSDPGGTNYTGSTSMTLVLPSNGAAPSPTTTNYTPSARAADISTLKPSQNGRLISLARWNKSLLLPKLTPSSSTDFTPVDPIDPQASGEPSSPSTNIFVAPDWILTARDGSNPVVQSVTSAMTTSASGASTIVGRYAYAIYDEGGLLDANVAGYPASGIPPYTSSNSDLNASSSKSALAFADLTQLPGIGAGPGIAGLSPTRQQAVINNLVGWRNYATAQPGGTLAGGFTYSTSQLTNYTNGILGNLTGFLKTSNIALVNGQTDRMFSSRQELMRLLLNGIAQDSTERGNLQNAFQYLGTFSRELNQPSYIPTVHSNVPSPTSTPNPPKVLPTGQGGTTASGADREINPNYQTVRVSKTFTRNDGLTAVVGDVLVNKRFPLQRLAWLTYKGPSQGRPQTDKDIAALIAAGIPYSYLQQGNTANIQKYFGLNWTTDTDPTTGVSTSVWKYNIHNSTTGKGAILRVGRNPAISGDGVPVPATYVEDLAIPRDPDFFELLKSAITVGSLGKSLSNKSSQVSNDSGDVAANQPYNYNCTPENSIDRQVLQIGANMINQARADNYPVQLYFDDGTGSIYTPYRIVGVASLPYLYQVMSGVLQVQPPNPLPRAGRDTGYPSTNANGTGVGGDAGYNASDMLVAPGVGAVMQLPVIWNPHDPASPTAVLGPTNFRVVADSTTPDQVSSGGAAPPYNKFFVYGNSLLGSDHNYSYQAQPFYSQSGTGSEIAKAITAANSEIDFTALPNSTALFPEPAILLRPGAITDSSGNTVTVAVGPSHLMRNDSAVSSFFSGTGSKGLPNFIPNAQGYPSSVAQPANTTPYIGFYLGAFPFAWMPPNGTAPVSSGQSGVTLSRAGGSQGGLSHACYLTYRMQCQDANGNWITYDTKYGKVEDSGPDFKPLSAGNFGTTSPEAALLPTEQGGYWASVTDPRTSRFGFHWNYTLTGTFGVGIGAVEISDELAKPVNINNGNGWLDYQNGILKTARPDAQSGYYFMTNWLQGGMPTNASGWMTWISSNQNVYAGLAPGLLSQNNTDNIYSPSRSYNDSNGNLTHTTNYYADPDGIVRRAMGAFVPVGTTSSPTYPPGAQFVASGDTTVGLPMARAFPGSAAPNSPTTTNYSSGSTLSQAQSRPYFLHRPFRSTAELGCVFSDTPWRNLDFFTAESGNTALLDVFCINESDNQSGLVAGKVNLNTKQSPVLASIIAGGSLDLANVNGNNAVSKPVDTATANNVASALTAYTSNNGPLQNVSELVGKWTANKDIGDMASAISGVNKGSLTQPAGGTRAPFYDGKLSYIGFSGGQWDSSAHKPKLTSPAQDVYSAYMNSTTAFNSNSNHSGTQETAVYIQRFREGPIRALAASGQTRVWNLMVDIVAQTGRYPTNATTLANFVVEGEQRYWVHLAIDRYTGAVIDKQIEVVKE